MLSKNHEKLQKVIEYEFNDPEILITALTHKSYVARTGTKSCNERMEFLGDSILSAIVVETLYTRYPHKPEGKLSQLKAQIVSASNLCAWAKKICLGDYVFLGRGENTREARQREGLLSDVFEAVAGAIYLDGGFEISKKFVLKFLDVQGEIISQDYKSRLQEFSQSVYKKLPEYKTVRESGPDHNRKFEVVVYVHKMLSGKGTGNSKREAQQSAAKQAIKRCKIPTSFPYKQCLSNKPRT
ncbi:ribonuclease 3 [Endomicrobiia bacterium]|nr:ribonuclease 3 [Endomicrobiia bacterium]GHT64824.1 ribonuclease 3 [Endomicrobiia bacterium]GHT71675.1 ribonuclease 3 [Endomicrobiia bacterium]GHT74415.1 ribonuclease 3 [Endomicrobiia bacterium]